MHFSLTAPGFLFAGALMEDINDPRRILVSGIFGTATQRQWECRLYPNQYNGLTKECFVRIDDTRYIDTDTVLETRGSLDTITFGLVKKLMEEYSNEQKMNSPEEFGEDPFEIF